MCSCYIISLFNDNIITPHVNVHFDFVSMCLLMQTDPNWGNFLYDDSTKTLNLIDFGAARDYPKSFVDDYLKMVSSLINT